jgi:hypothetical protein
MTPVEVERWQVRMHSGAIHVIDPLILTTIEESEEAARRFALGKQVEPMFDEVASGFIVVDAYDRLEAQHAKTRTILFIAHIESIRILTVQMDARP